MKGKPVYRISKVDTRIYVKGFSGVLVYKAMYAILIALGVFVGLYLLTSPFIALLVVPLLLVALYRLNKLQQTLGPDGYQKRQIARQLPAFISIKQEIKQLF
ncbi:DUF4133 domain-containing protein [Carboxylicivirga mesophila]|uniref:DUF4133 domain-containing protein n=1 Tax=Carboxylicivirga mesophila TaxID=1166478 RepID=A0ABS5K731_9BACT|nr:DUF4133 domain-containing protein [Carboxylicivirga mesophila]MBS2210707.1 DUF4133 domain-containing protein [Carboxylicivirga mesophila]